MRGHVLYDGRWVKWADLVKLKREQRKATNAAQLDLFPDAPKDARPNSQRTPKGRFENPTLFEEEEKTREPS